ncbi:hypothetical protein SAMN05216350_108206 [Polaromonas sp. YR568]|uniref:hypothetical protein n=1 Tax=Polaromonas sp. YR568 TaxID=1855301 RepID=UPI0008E27D78|nr:hypothetical protein [Polaromonas sp. YR568]SFU93070.1 hypothetical protein SAMN05216350_108206 [Polaromonas sp. YR568]
MASSEYFITVARRVIVGGLIAVGLTTAALAAPDDAPAWPSERELLVAMRAGVKGGANKAETLLIRAMHEVRVGKTETAFLVSVWLPARGRNFSSGVFLYRPALKQARELDYSQSLGLQYVAGRYGEFSLLENYDSGQGTEDFIHALVRFNGWEMQVLHQAKFGNNLGACAEASVEFPACRQTLVKFQLLVNPATDDVEMVEVTTRLDASSKEKLLTTLRRLRLDGNRFTPVKTR